MRKGWEVKTLGEVLEKTETIDPTKNPEKAFVYIDVSSVNNKSFSIENPVSLKGKDAPSRARKLIKTGDVIFATVRPTLKRIAFVTQDFNNHVCSTGYFVLRGKNNIENKYLFYYLFTDTFNKNMEQLQKGASYPAVTDNNVKEQFIAYPKSPSEQTKIVAILDDAFAAIEQAKANLLRNLQNAKELFQSELNSIFTTKGKDWEEKKLGDVLQKTETINPLSTPTNEFIYIDVSSVNKETLLIEETTLIKGKNAPSRARKLIKTNDVIFATVRPTLKRIAIIPESYNMQICSTGYFVLRASQIIHFKLLFYYLQTYYFQDKMEKLQKGASYPAVTDGEVRNQIITFPTNKTQQQQIVQRLDALAEVTKKLESIYQQKLDNLEELKKSILQKAFSGELNYEVASPLEVVHTAIPNNISVIDLHAGLIAVAMQRHIAKNSMNTFHHVKSEKIVHLLEYHLEINLERNPVKDAAGPNDFPLKLQVEESAQNAGYFTVTKSEKGIYNYKKGKQFKKIISEVQSALPDRINEVNSLIDLFVPLKTRQAEILATVYAAWNNLLLEGKEITDEAIVTEAREDWHEEKLKIKRHRFFNAITWMTSKGLIPTGRGKLVIPKTLAA